MTGCQSWVTRPTEFHRSAQPALLSRQGTSMSDSNAPVTGSVAAHSTTAGMYPQRWKALAVLVIGLLVVILDNTILNVALNTFFEDPGATQNELVWAINAY